MACAPGLLGLSLSARSAGETGSQSSAEAGAPGADAGAPKHARSAAAARAERSVRLIALCRRRTLEDNLGAVIRLHRAIKSPQRCIRGLRVGNARENEMPLHLHDAIFLRG